MDKMREEFEVEYIKSLNSKYFSCEDEKLCYIKKDDSGEYLHDLTYNAFHWWKASRAVLRVELPKPELGENGNMYVGYDHVKDAIDDAGVSYK